MSENKCFSCKFYVEIVDEEHSFHKCALSWQSRDRFEWCGKWKPKK